MTVNDVMEQLGITSKTQPVLDELAKMTLKQIENMSEEQKQRIREMFGNKWSERCIGELDLSGNHKLQEDGTMVINFDLHDVTENNEKG